MSLDRLFKKIISFLYSLLFFLVPLFFTFVNSELFEFNKILLVYAFTLLIIGLWLWRIILNKKIIFKRTFLDIPLLIFLASQALSTIFSIDRHTSVWGYYSRFNGGLLSTISYLLLYFAFVSNCEKEDVKKIIKISLIAALIISVYGILEHFGHSFSCLMAIKKFDVSCWVQDVKTRVFATLGQPNWLAAYLSILLPILLASALNRPPNPKIHGSWFMVHGSKFKVHGSKFMVHGSKFMVHGSWFMVQSSWFIILYLCLLFTGSRSGFLGFLAAFIFLGLTEILINGRQSLKLLIFYFFLLSLPLTIFGSPFSQLNQFIYYKNIISRFSSSNQISPAPSAKIQGPALEVGGTESGKIRQIVWKGTFEIFKRYPILGSGVETFAYSYYSFRPMEHNLVSEWDFLYNKAHNEYLNYLSTTGIIGLGSYLLIIFLFIFWNIKNETQKLKTSEKSLEWRFILQYSLFAGWLSILISNFFGFSVVAVSLYFYLIPAFIFVLNNSEDNLTSKTSNNINRPSLFPFAAILLIIGYLALSLINIWRADYYYAQGGKMTKNGEYVLAYQNLYKAVELSPNEPVFLNELSSAAANLALISAVNKDATSAAALIDLGAKYSNQAIKISPSNLNILKTRAKVFYSFSTIDPQYLDEALKTLLTIIRLSPTDPRPVYNLGLILYQQKKTEEAILLLKKALEMKPNYEEVRSALAQIYENQGKKEEALKELEYIYTVKPQDEELKARIEKLKEK